MGEGAQGAFASLWQYVMFFNLIKGFAVSVIVFVLYKRVSRLFKAINLQSLSENDTIETEDETYIE